MTYIDEKEKGVQYRVRPGAYAIIVREEDDKIGIVTDGKDIFYLGGGIEEGESELEALKRELIEEAGYTLKNIQEFDKIGSYLFAEEHGYLEVIANVFIAEFDEKITEPVEKDHHIIWVSAEDYIGKMFREWQNYILKEFIQKRKRK